MVHTICMSETQKKKPVPPSRKGARLTEEQKQRMSEIAKAKGFGKWMKGKKNSPESNRKKSENSARYWLGKKRGPQSQETIRKRSESMKGHAVSEKTRERMRNLAKGKFGPSHPKWVEEKKRPLYKAVRQLYKYVEWRTSIFTRDNFTCVLCGFKGYIEADHFPVRFVEIMRKHEIEDVDQAIQCEELWDTNNGRTLCKPCHLKTPTWGNTRLQRSVKQ